MQQAFSETSNQISAQKSTAQAAKEQPTTEATTATEEKQLRSTPAVNQGDKAVPDPHLFPQHIGHSMQESMTPSAHKRKQIVKVPIAANNTQLQNIAKEKMEELTDQHTASVKRATSKKPLNLK